MKGYTHVIRWFARHFLKSHQMLCGAPDASSPRLASPIYLFLNQCYRAPGTRAGRPWLYETVEETPLSLRNSQSDSPCVSVVQTQLVYNLHSFICKNGMMVPFDSNPPAHCLSASGHSTSAFSLLLTCSLPSYPSDGSRRDTRGVKGEDFILWDQGSATVLPQSNCLLEALSHPLEPGVSFPSSLGEMHRKIRLPLLLCQLKAPSVVQLL